MSEIVEINSEAGTANGYLAIPQGGKGPGILLLHAWWGLTPFFKQLADRLASEGYVVLATSFLCVVQPLFELTHYSWVRNSRWEDWTIRLYLLFESIAAVGGVVLATRDRNLWWLLATLVAIVAPVLMIVWISQMVPVTLR